MVVELGEVASATRFNLFGPALYSLDAQDSFGDDVKVGWDQLGGKGSKGSECAVCVGFICLCSLLVWMLDDSFWG